MAKSKKKVVRTRANSTGSIWTDPVTGYLYAVVAWSEINPATGKPRIRKKTRRAKSGTRKEAYALIPGLQAEVEKERKAQALSALRLESNVAAGVTLKEREIKPDSITFGELATYYKEDRLFDVVFNDQDIRVKGVASWKDKRAKVDALVRYFGAARLVSTFTKKQLKKYREDRLLSPATTRHKLKGSDQWITKPRRDKTTGKIKTVSIKSVHLELTELRTMFNFAFDESWLSVPPITSWKELIVPGEEVARELIATTGEEKALHKALAAPRRRHLSPYMLTAFDHGCRSIELRQLLVQDVDFDTNLFSVYSAKGKRRLRREIYMTTRVHEALWQCCQDKQPTEHVFTYDVKVKGADGKKILERRPLKTPPKKAFASAKLDVGKASNGEIDLTAFRGHDARHTNITRLVRSGMAVAEASKHAGHRQLATTYRYINPDHSSRVQAAQLIENYTEAPVVQFENKRKQKQRA